MEDKGCPSQEKVDILTPKWAKHLPVHKVESHLACIDKKRRKKTMAFFRYNIAELRIGGEQFWSIPGPNPWIWSGDGDKLIELRRLPRTDEQQQEREEGGEEEDDGREERGVDGRDGGILVDFLGTGTTQLLRFPWTYDYGSVVQGRALTIRERGGEECERRVLRIFVDLSEDEADFLIHRLRSSAPFPSPASTPPVDSGAAPSESGSGSEQ